MTEDARQFNTDQRKKMAKKGQAQPGGSFPIANAQDLKNAIQAYGRSKNKAATKAHIIKRARALGLTKLLPDAWKVSTASADQATLLNLHIDCPECERSFLHEDALADHAEAVHTFNDIERMVSEVVREKYSRPSTKDAAGVYSWVTDMAEDWVVFTVEGNSKVDLFKAAYEISGLTATLGEPVEVVRKTIYEPVLKPSA